MTTAVFPGSFDPPTYGHLNIIERASRLFDKIDVLISINPDKKCLFSDKERYDLLIKLTENYKNVLFIYGIHLLPTTAENPAQMC